MKSGLGKSAARRTMRVATAFTGFAAAGAAFGPAAHAAPANSPVPEPYVLWVKTSAEVYAIQVCGYKSVGAGEWYCTAKEANPHWNLSSHSNYFGTNWKRGKVNVWMWNSFSSEWGHTCNTNGAYHGVFRTGAAGSGVSLSAGYHVPLGVPGTSEC